MYTGKPKVKVIVFDFDGTLVDSNTLKRDAFFQVFLPSKVDRYIIEDTLNELHECSRFKIIEAILSRAGLDKTKLSYYADSYNAVVEDGAKTCREIPGAKDFLTDWHRDVRLYVCSVTPTEPLRRIIAFRNWTNYFVEIFGHPHEKVPCVKDILAREAIEPGRLIIFGDGYGDERAAKENQTIFVKAGTSECFQDLRRLLGGTLYVSG